MSKRTALAALYSGFGLALVAARDPAAVVGLLAVVPVLLALGRGRLPSSIGR